MVLQNDPQNQPTFRTISRREKQDIASAVALKIKSLVKGDRSDVRNWVRAAHIVALMVKTVSFWCAAQPEIAHLVDKTRGICWKIPEINASEHNTNKLRATLIIYDARLSAKEQIRVLAHEMTHAILWNTEWSFERDFDHHDDYEGFNGSRYDTVDHRIARMVEHIVDNPKFWTEQQD